MKRKTFAVDIDGTITENGGGRINLDALNSLRYIRKLGHNVIFVSGRSSVEGYLLAVYGGLNTIAVGENGGCITYGANDHLLLGNKVKCVDALQVIRSQLSDIVEKPVFPRMTEVVLERTFDIEKAKQVVEHSKLDVVLSDSQYAIHINSAGINKARGFEEVMKRLNVSREDVISIGDSDTDIPLFNVSKISIAVGNASDKVKSHATMSVSAHAGDGVIEALDKIAPSLLEI
ncbi:phosphoglycolate phosphatase [Candidatus Nitrosotenuis chungbukensis]|uniref:phosphoglycolate phosphatase n=1 Tax=Candidatus Nitrosotenuis chungbukensis TaxID=1353246 RepID=UPI0005B2D6B4|nr:phosphoglycolate phosphatase [Candidatus Nitrosotenuis chungbukensis]WKT57333.1 phosphoglycolate phosphatase [Candidatus Nitrosotenuis chungbukensis]